LADCLKDAVNVCLRNLDDFQLAVALARVYEGDDGPVLHQIINDHILPRAAEEGDRWLASWAFWMIGDRGKSVQALIVGPLMVVLLTCKLAAARWIDSSCYSQALYNTNRRSCTSGVISSVER
jgi:hypothetical protein